MIQKQRLGVNTQAHAVMHLPWGGVETWVTPQVLYSPPAVRRLPRGSTGFTRNGRPSSPYAIQTFSTCEVICKIYKYGNVGPPYTAPSVVQVTAGRAEQLLTLTSGQPSR